MNFDALLTHTGEYRIDYFYGDEQGLDMISGASINATSYEEAKVKAVDNMPEIAKSYRIARIVFNSLDKGVKWAVFDD